MTCRDTHWTTYQTETLEGEWEDALEICPDCSSLSAITLKKLQERYNNELLDDESRQELRDQILRLKRRVP